MTLADAAYVVGPLAGPVIALFGYVIVWGSTRRRDILVVTFVSAFFVVASFRVYWFAWGIAFEPSDAARVPHPVVQYAVDAAFVVCALTATMLVALVTWVRVQSGWRGSAEFAAAAAAAERRG